jgi:hypothetical protein
MNAKAPKVTGDTADVAQMDHIQRVIEEAILPYRENTEASIVVGALIRVARILLSLYRPGKRDALISDTVTYLQAARADVGPERAKSPLATLGFWLPPGSQN